MSIQAISLSLSLSVISFLTLSNFFFCFKKYAAEEKNFFLINKKYAVAAAKSLQSRLTLCNPIDGRPPGSSIPGILQG